MSRLLRWMAGTFSARESMRATPTKPRLQHALHWIQKGLAVVTSAILLAQPLQAAEADLPAWLNALHEAPLKHNYQGTMVISVGDQMVSAHITHVVDAGIPLERVDVLTGQPRTSFRQGNRVITTWPDAKRWISEDRSDLGVFPGATGSALERVRQFYQLKALREDRVAGRQAQVFEVIPRDQSRWGYRVWRDQTTHLIVKIQTLAPRSLEVLEQSAFTALETGQAIDASVILRHLQPPSGYEVQRREVRTVDPEQWRLRYAASETGFSPTRAQLPIKQSDPLPQQPLQWLFSDGLASVSVFFEPAAAVVGVRERAIRQGATHTLLRETERMRLTLVGEVPLPTLVQIANGISVD